MQAELLHIQQRINAVAAKIRQLIATDPRLRPDRNILLAAAQQVLDSLYDQKRLLLCTREARPHASTRSRTRKGRP